MTAILAATSDRLGMFILGALCGTIAAGVVMTIWSTLNEVQAGLRKRQIARRYGRQHSPTVTSNPDPLIRRGRT